MSSRGPRVGQVLQKVLGVGYVAAGIGNLVFTTPHRDEVFDSFADMAWFPPYEWLINQVIEPAGLPFMVGLVAFEAAVGAALVVSDDDLARRVNWVAVAFNVALIPSLAFPYFFGNFALIVLHTVLARDLWGMTSAPRPTESATARFNRMGGIADVPRAGRVAGSVRRGGRVRRRRG